MTPAYSSASLAALPSKGWRGKRKVAPCRYLISYPGQCSSLVSLIRATRSSLLWMAKRQLLVGWPFWYYFEHYSDVFGVWWRYYLNTWVDEPPEKISVLWTSSALWGVMPYSACPLRSARTWRKRAETKRKLLLARPKRSPTNIQIKKKCLWILDSGIKDLLFINLQLEVKNFSISCLVAWLPNGSSER